MSFPINYAKVCWCGRSLADLVSPKVSYQNVRVWCFDVGSSSKFCTVVAFPLVGYEVGCKNQSLLRFEDATSEVVSNFINQHDVRAFCSCVFSGHARSWNTVVTWIIGFWWTHASQTGRLLFISLFRAYYSIYTTLKIR